MFSSTGTLVENISEAVRYHINRLTYMLEILSVLPNSIISSDKGYCFILGVLPAHQG